MDGRKHSQNKHSEPSVPAKGLLGETYSLLQVYRNSFRSCFYEAPALECGTELADFSFAPWVRMFGVACSRPMSIEFLMVSPARISIVIKRAGSPRSGQMLYRYLRETAQISRDEFGNAISERICIALEFTVTHMMCVNSRKAELSGSVFAVLSHVWDAIYENAKSNERWWRKYWAMIRQSRS